MEYRILHDTCFQIHGCYSGTTVADEMKILPELYNPALGWAKQRLEELNLNHAVKRDIPRFYGILGAPPEVKANNREN